MSVVATSVRADAPGPNVMGPARIGLLAAASVGITAFMLWTCLEHWAWRVPTRHERTAVDLAIFSLGWLSVALGFVVGLRLWIRAPGNPTGRWLWLAALAVAAWHIGIFTPVAWLQPLVLGDFVDVPILAMAFLGFPTGRPSRRVTRCIAIVAGCRLLTGAVSCLFAADTFPSDWPRALFRWWDPWTYLTLGAISAWVFGVVPAVLAGASLIRQRRRLPTDARGLVSAITVSGVAIAAIEVTHLAVFNLGQALLYDLTSWTPSAIFRLTLAGQRAEVGIAAVGLAVAFAHRRRSVSHRPRRLDIDLGSARAVTSPTVALRALLADPTATMLYRRPDGEWVDDRGDPARPDAPGRTTTIIVSDDGTPVAAVDLDAQHHASAELVEVAGATAATRLRAERATALARSTQAQLVAVQHAVLDASDAARRQLERDLHDGAQQGLVGLALAARLAAREDDAAARSDLVDLVERTRLDLSALVSTGSPAALGRGLNAALTSLAASAPIPVEVHAHGDLPASQPAATVMWFVASEAMANSVKHSGATRLSVRSHVESDRAWIEVADDGCGGVRDVPISIERRAAEAGATVTVTSPAGGGTSVVTLVPLTPSARMTPSVPSSPLAPLAKSAQSVPQDRGDA